MFMAVTVPLSCTSLADQQWIQMSFVTVRLVIFFFDGWYNSRCVRLRRASLWLASGTRLWHFIGETNEYRSSHNDVYFRLYHAVCSTNSTTIADETRNKTGLSRVFVIATTLSCTSSLLLGILLAIFFGQDQPDTVNLNWVNYHGGTGEADPAAWATAISSYTVLAAAIHCFPQSALVAISTGGILMGAIYGDRVHEVEKDWRIRTAFRLLASVPPAFGALVLSDFSVIANYILLVKAVRTFRSTGGVRCPAVALSDLLFISFGPLVEVTLSFPPPIAPP
jgi:hypothetical protein